MFKRFLENLSMAFQFLIKPRLLMERVESINRKIDDRTGYTMVSIGLIQDLKKQQEKYPTDPTVKEKVESIKEAPSNKEELTQLMIILKSLADAEEKECEVCNQKYLFSCSHTVLAPKKTDKPNQEKLRNLSLDLSDLEDKR